MAQKTAILLVVVLIAGIAIGYIGGYMTFPTTSVPDARANLQQQVDELESQIVTLNQEIQNLQAQIEQRTEGSEEPEFAREVIYISCSEAEAIINITYEFEYFIGANIKLTIKNIGTEVIGYKADGTPGDFKGYFIVRVSAQDSYGRNVTMWFLPYEFKIGQVEKPRKSSESHWGKDITSLYSEEEVFTRASVPYSPEEDNIKTYTIEIKYVPG